jgi:hypothetical protein
MTDLIIRNVPDEILAEIGKLAEAANQSRQQYLLTRLAELVESGPLPTRWGEGFLASTPTGGEITMRCLEASVQADAKNLGEEETEAYKRAKLLASPKNGSKWAEARKILEEAGFEVFNI